MNIQTKQKIAGVMVPAALFLALAAPAFAMPEISDNKKTTVAEVKSVAKATEEIEKRVSDLTELSARIAGMKNVGAEVKASLTTTIQTSITDLNALKAKIAADATVAELKADMQTLTASYRIYALVMPQLRILAAAERANTIADMMTAMNAKLQARIDADKAAGKDVTAMLAAQADMQAKLADVKLQTTAAINYVSGLKPDNGDKAVMTANTTALTKARADLRVAESDLKAAQKDIRTILGHMKGSSVNAKNHDGENDR